MANPPVNRRPGVDASIVQADWVRGYDGPQVTDDPCDIILSNGANEVDGRVSDLFIWNRSEERDQPMFIFAVGADFTGLTATMGVYAGLVGDPNGIITDNIGSLYVSNNPAAIWQNQDGANTWKKISDDLGGENLEETLAIGNFTGDQALIISDGALARIIGEENTTGGAGAPVKVYGGTASGATGDGGAVWITSGVTTGGNTGEVLVRSADILAGAGNVGPVRLFGGNTTGGGNGGDISATAGNGAQGGEVLLQGGDGANVGGDRGGRIQFLAGNSPADGDGGRVNIASGSPGNPISFGNSFTPGEAGQINIQGGNSASAETGGTIFVRGGQGGSAGGPGGPIILEGGPGGPGADDGKIEARGIFFGENYLRDDGDPNVLGKIAPEGSLYQRSTAGFGQAWVNVNGTPTGWSQLLSGGGGIVSALTQIQYGSLQASSDGLNDELAADGTFYATVGAGPQQLVYQVNSKSNTQGPDNTPAMTLGAAAGGEGGVYLDTHLSRNSRARITFKISINQTDADTRFFFGFTQSLFGNTAIEQLEQDSPPGNWFGIQKGTGDTAWRFRAQFGASTDNVASAITVTDGATYYFAFDLFEDAEGGVSVAILDEEFTQVASHTYSTAALISNAGPLRPLGGIGSTAANKSVFLHNIAVVSRIDLAEKAFAGGLAGFAPPLSQVLLAGNETGASNIIVDHAQGIYGKDDDDGTSGAVLELASGTTTNIGGSSGDALFSSADVSIAGFTGDTGDIVVASGKIDDGTNTASGDTGSVILVSGANEGVSGITGGVVLSSGAFVPGAGGALATTGDVLIGVGAFGTSAANPGLLSLAGGRTSLNGVDGGDIEITSGENTVNGASGQITLSTANIAVDGNSGDLRLFTGLAGTNSGNSGSILLLVGSTRAPGAVAGDVQIGAGSSGFGLGADAGDVFISSGTSELAQGGNIEFTTGGSTIGGFRGGDFVFNPGSGPAGDGEVIINGKLTVTGLIDPTGLVLTGQALVPTVVNPGDGLLWVDNTGANTILNYTDDANVTIQLGAGGGGAGTLEATLALGNETGNKALLISDGDQAGIIGQDSAVTDGGNILVTAGSSLVGGGGIGGRFQVTTGDADPSGNGAGGLLRLLTAEGAGTGAGGELFFQTGDGGATDGWGGHFNTLLGAGQGTGSGGSYLLVSGDGGAGGGNGGEIRLKPGAGAGGGVAGVVELDGDVRIAGDLQVDGVIDPLGIGFVAQGANPIPLPGGGTPLAGSIWTNVAGDLIFTNIGVGDLNISTSIASGVGSLSATLAVGATTGVNGIEFSLGSPGISGADNAGGNGGNIAMVAGSSTGGGGSGGNYSILSGSPDTNGSGGSFLVALAPGDGTGNGGSYVVSMGDGGATSGNGGSWGIAMGDGGGTGKGGGSKISSGDGGGGGGDGGDLEFALGSATAGSGSGGGFLVASGGSFGATVGGGISLAAGAGGGGAGAGDGGNVLLQGGNQVGVGDYGGVRIRAGGATTVAISSGDIELVSAPSATGTESASFLLTGGSAGKPGVVTGVGGNGAAGSNSVGGAVSFGAGNGAGSGNGGEAILQAGSGDLTGDGGKGRFNAGSAAGGNGAGGEIEIFAGNGSGTGAGGALTLTSGGVGGTGTTGALTIETKNSSGAATSRVGPLRIAGGDLVNGDLAVAGPVVVQGGGFGGGAATVQGGPVTIAGGDLRAPGLVVGLVSAGTGGTVKIRGGYSADVLNGGFVEIIGGGGGDTAAGGANGGSVAIRGEAAVIGTDGSGGGVTINGGAADGTGVPGQITLGSPAGDTLNFDSPAMKLGTVTPGVVAPGVYSITYASLGWTAFSSIPRVVQITAETSSGNVVVVVPLTIGIGVNLCNVDTSAGFAGSERLHVVAYL